MTPIKILAVDDNEQNLKLIDVLLTSDGYEVVVAGNAQEALGVLETTIPDVILMDIEMPGMDGLELTRRLKADPKTSGIVIVALTAYAMKGDRERILAGGCDGYIPKPIDTRTFPKTVGSFLRTSPGHSQDSKGTVLIVEDNPITRKMFRAALEVEGYEVLGAEDGDAALKILSARRPDLIIQDLILPNDDGIELVGRIQAMPNGTGVPIIAVSGFLSKLEEAEAHRLGFTQYMLKPVAPSSLLESVNAHLSVARKWPDRPGTGMRVLLVDDDPVQLKLQRVQLEQLGFEVTLASDGVEALESARKSAPAAIVSDVLMSRMDGFRLSSSIRQDSRLARTPVILVSTAYIEHEDLILAKESGADGLVVRTPQSDQMVSELLAALKHERPEEVLSEVELSDHYLRRIARQLERQVAENKALTRKIAQQEAVFSIMTALATSLRHEANVETLLESVFTTCLDAAGVSRGAAYLRDGGGKLALSVMFGYPDSARKDLENFFGQWELLESTASGSVPVLLPDGVLSPEETNRLLAASGTRSLIIIPLGIERKSLGAIAMGSGTRFIASDWLPFSDVIAGQISQVVELTRASNELRRSQTMFRQMAGAIEDVFWMVTADFQEMLYVSPAYSKIWGRSPKDVLANPAVWLDTIHPDDRAEVERKNRHPENLDGAVLEYRIVRPDNSVRWISDQFFAIRDELGTIYRFCGTAKDITDRKTAVDTLRASEERMRRFFELGLIGMTITTPDWRCIDANAVLCEMLGYSREELINKSWGDVTHPDDVALSEAGMKDLRSGRKDAYEVHKRYIRRDGQVVDVILSARCVRNETGEIDYIVALTQDITQRKRREAELHLKNALLSTIQEVSLDGILVVGAESDVLSYNKRFLELWGVSSKLAEGGDDRVVLAKVMNFVADPDAFLAKVQYLYEHRKETSHDEILLKDGRCFERYSAPLFSSEGAYYGRVWFFRDITERKEAEDDILRQNSELDRRVAERTAELADANVEMQAARMEADRANSAKSEFLSRMSHELRTPLNATIGFAQVLQRGELNARQSECVENIVTAGNHLLSLINEVLEISRIESGRVSNVPKLVVVSDLVHEAIDLVRPIAESRRVTLRFPEDVGTPEIIHVDPQRLKQVLLNLLGNAIKYNHEGGEVALEWKLHGRESITFSVLDTGPGIPAEEIHRLFTPFERLDAAQKGIEGTGLGLAVSRRLVDAMGGEIGAKSELGQGSTFWVRIPVGKGAAS